MRSATARAAGMSTLTTLLALTLALSACGSDDDTASVTASGTVATTTSTSDHDAAGHDTADHATGHDDQAAHGDQDAGGHAGDDHGAHGDEAAAGDHAAHGGSIKLGTAEEGDLRVEVAAMPEAVEFTVAEGDRMRKHPPAPGDNAHVMVLVSDAESRDRLPDSAVTAQFVGPDGRDVHNGPLYPMIGMGVGLHYGDNMRLPEDGKYVATIVVSPPRIGRHPDAADRYAKPVRLEVPFDWKTP
ncbi:MAG: iron transporter [Solirubrobacteraceae bacterium]